MERKMERKKWSRNYFARNVKKKFEDLEESSINLNIWSCVTFGWRFQFLGVLQIGIKCALAWIAQLESMRQLHNVFFFPSVFHSYFIFWKKWFDRKWRSNEMNSTENFWTAEKNTSVCWYRHTITQWQVTLLQFNRINVHWV
jgi:hypothetical protein